MMLGIDKGSSDKDKSKNLNLQNDNREEGAVNPQ
jgi:hypothetical protein